MTCWNVYAGNSTTVTPDPQVVEFCKFIILTEPNLAADAQAVIDAIAADSNPTTLTPFKSIQSVTPDDATLTLPSNNTILRVASTDHADGDSVYTWRKVHGAGNVTFSPNGTAAAKDCTILFDGTPGLYLFEVTMSDSRGLTEVYDTVAVTLYDTGGSLPSNNAPTANAQSPTVVQATPTPVILTATDPEGYALTYTVTSQPSNGVLSGTAPYLAYTPESTYTGSDSFQFEAMDSEGQVSSATVSITVTAASAFEVAVYEPFDYTVGGLNGQSGSSEVGLTGNWTAHTSTTLVAGSLSHGSMGTLGNSIGNLSGGANDWGGTRSIDASALAANGLLDDGATLWFSAVVGYGTGVNLTNARLFVMLANDQFNSGSYNYWINDDGAQLGSGIGMTLGRHDFTNGRVTATQVQDLSQVDGLAGNIQGTWEGTGGLYGEGEHGLIVAKITWGATAGDDDTIELYQPSTDMSLPAAPISVLTTNVDQSTFDTITFSRGDVVVLDEIRLGGSYQSVQLGNAPMTPDSAAPSPDPMAFQSAPAAVSDDSITMTAASAYDLSGVEYYFAETSGNPGGDDSGWQDSPVYTDSGLLADTQYSYTVTARDKSSAQNSTAASAAASATTTGTPSGDTTPPTPNPASFAAAPAADSQTAVSMTSVTGSDASGPVEYLFTETSGNPGGTSSSWQTSPSYTDSGLSASTQYSYTVRMRDGVGNTGNASSAASATTSTGPDLVAPNPNPMTWAVAPAAGAGGVSGISYIQITDDADSGISSANTYTHAIDWGTSGTATVNGVVFANEINVAAGAQSNPGTRDLRPQPALRQHTSCR